VCADAGRDFGTHVRRYRLAIDDARRHVASIGAGSC
jgi:hypothetical protein